ncbi:hypothetical protein [Pseudorhizobium flavum]|uniref:hypothetical protein n=1 Tax=Pseudorhizobium flavum TaxID=1335061 RepID=UPI00376F6C79
MDKVNLQALILQAADGDPVEALVIGSMNKRLREMQDLSDPVVVPRELRGVILNWQEAKQYLDYEVDQFSVNEHDPIIVWTSTFVITLGFDDGPIRPVRVPRDPKGEPLW